MKRRRNVSLRTKFFASIFLDVALLILVFVVTTIFMVLFGKTQNRVLLWTGIGVFFFGLSLLITATTFIVIYFTKVFDKGLFRVTLHNILAIKDNQNREYHHGLFRKSKSCFFSSSFLELIVI